MKEINSRANRHDIGALQSTRRTLKGLARTSTADIFSTQTTKLHYAFHHGGRSELQFNVGFEDDSQGWQFRDGIAFSFERSRTLPSPAETLAPKVRLFNDFIELNADLFADLRMWHFENGQRSPDYMPTAIPWERVKDGIFVFLGRRSPVNTIDYELVLHDMDRLLPIYRYVESGGATPPVPVLTNTSFVFRPGCSAKASAAVAPSARRQIDIALRHNQLQEALYRKLATEHGPESIGTEISSGNGTRIDVVLRQGNDFYFYEIKTAISPRACIREAVGQLLEYAFWPGGQSATRLIVVGETAIDHEANEYLNKLRQAFSLPIDYQQITA